MATFAGALGRGLAGYAANRERSDARDRDIEQQQRAEARQAMLDERQRVQMEAQAQAMKEQRERNAAEDVRRGEMDQRDNFERGYRTQGDTRREAGAVREAAPSLSGMGPNGALMSMGAATMATGLDRRASEAPAFTMGGKPMVKSAMSLAERTADAQVKERNRERTQDYERQDARDVRQNAQTIARDRESRAFTAGENAKNRNATMAGITARAAVQPPRAALPTEGERKAAALYSVAQQGAETLEKLLVQTGADGKPSMRGAPSWMERAKQKVGMDVGNVVTSDQQRQVTQAGLQLSDMWLRYTSGAAVPESEVFRFAQTFTPLPGDDPTTLKQKMEARGRILSALKGAAGRALVVPPEAGTEPDMNDPGFRAFLQQRREDEP